jgi:DNA-binding beta-propeller fold protein YncE
VLKAPWAEKCLYKWAGGEESPPGEFGHYVSLEAEGGPNSFTVAPNGDIYINDPLNKRIQRFSPEGAFISVIPINAGFICVDKDNNIYVTRVYPEGFIDKYDQFGNLLESHQVDAGKKRISAIETETTNIHNIYCDDLGGVFVSFSHNYQKLDEVAKTIIDTAWGGICQVGNATGAFSLEMQNNAVKEQGFLGINSAALGKGYFFADRGNIYLISFEGDTIKTLNPMLDSFLGCDENLNFYTRETAFDFYASEYDERKHSPLVRKYNSNGQLLTTFRYWCGKPYTGIFIGFGFSSTIGDCIFLDKKGNLYVFCQSHEDGIKVIKWYKAN